jgi:TPR repeat protein
MYAQGIDVPQDLVQAAEWCQKAAELGHPGAQLLDLVFVVHPVGEGDFIQGAAFTSPR